MQADIEQLWRFQRSTQRCFNYELKEVIKFEERLETIRSVCENLKLQAIQP